MSFGSNDFIKAQAAVHAARQSVEFRRANAVPPLTNRGGNFFTLPDSPPLVHAPVLDYLSFTCAMNVKNAIDEIHTFLTRWFFPDSASKHSDLICIDLKPVGYLAYENSCNLYRIDPDTLEKISIGIAAWGGNGGRVFISFSGQGCVWFQHLQDMYNDLVSLNSRLTRVDLALDFFNGEYPVEMCKSIYDEGKFVSRGGKPKHTMIGDWNDSNRTFGGRSFYVGARDSGKMLRVYEKGRELGAKHSAWTRWELELRNKDREIPLDVIIKPFPYFVGGYKALEELFGSYCSDVPYLIPTQQKKGEIILANAVHYGKTAYGPLLKSFKDAGISAEQIVQLFTDGVKSSPRRLSPSLVHADFIECIYNSYADKKDWDIENEIKRTAIRPHEMPVIDLSPMIEEDMSWGGVDFWDMFPNLR